jgi:hypothetical protein
MTNAIILNFKGSQRSRRGVEKDESLVVCSFCRRKIILRWETYGFFTMIGINDQWFG